jgi:hypothetical protein
MPSLQVKKKLLRENGIPVRNSATEKDITRKWKALMKKEDAQFRFDGAPKKSTSTLSQWILVIIIITVIIYATNISNK